LNKIQVPVPEILNNVEEAEIASLLPDMLRENRVITFLLMGCTILASTTHDLTNLKDAPCTVMIFTGYTTGV
jgi:hypothetical protein